MGVAVNSCSLAVAKNSRTQNSVMGSESEKKGHVTDYLSSDMVLDLVRSAGTITTHSLLISLGK